MIGAFFACVASSALAPVAAQPFMPGKSDPAPLDADRQLDLAKRLLAAGQNEAAIEQLHPVIAADPKHFDAQLLVGVAYHKLRRYEQAQGYLEKARELAPNDARPNYPLGFCLYYLGQREAARKAFEKFIAAFPDHGHAYLGLGLIEFDDDRLDEAAACFKKCIELNARYADDPTRASFQGSGHVRLGDVYERQQKFEQARDQYIKATQFAEADASLYAAYFKLARVQNRLGDHEGAKKSMQKFEETKDKIRPSEGFPEQ